MTGVIYARYSSSGQREESIEGQIRECTEFAKKKGITVLCHYIDRATSAKTDKRPEFQRMMRDSSKRLFDVVIVWKIDRFSRNRRDSAKYKDILKENGIYLLSAKENFEGTMGIVIESMMEGYAEFYSADLSEKVIRGMTDNALKCRYNGGGPVGYVIDSEQHFAIDELTAPAVLEAFTAYSQGKTVKSIVEELNRKGIVTKHNKPMSINSVTRMLRNRKYIGEYKYRDIVDPNGIPAIVSADLFEHVQKRLAKNKKAPARFKAVEEQYLLTTKLHCGKCSSFMVGESGTSRTQKIHQYYKCANVKKRKGCDKKSVKKQWVEDIVINETLAILNDKATFNYIVDTAMAYQERENITLPMLKNQLSETEKGIENMLNAIQQGILTPTTKQRLEELEERKEQLELSILDEEMGNTVLSREQVEFWLLMFRDIDITDCDQRQRLVDIFINAIYLYDDKVVFTYNYSEDTKTIMFDEIKEKLSSDLKAGGLPGRPPSTLVTGAKRLTGGTRFPRVPLPASGGAEKRI